MNQKPTDIQSPSCNDSEQTPAQQGQAPSATNESKQSASDKVLELFNGLASGIKYANESLKQRHDSIMGIQNVKGLRDAAAKTFTNSSRPPERFFALMLSEKFTEFGVAPAWRAYPILNDVEPDPATRTALIDLRLIDLQWLHTRTDRSRYREHSNALLRQLMMKDKFDYVLAQELASSHPDRDASIRELGLTEDLQRDLVVYKSLAIEEEQQALIRQRSEVAKDIEIAAHRNPRMGQKLIRVIPDRLDQWMSTRATQSQSKLVMYDTYKKITGSNISASSYNTKLQSLQNALRLAKSEFMF